jgi:hypothetical protein
VAAMSRTVRMPCDACGADTSGMTGVLNVSIGPDEAGAGDRTTLRACPGVCAAALDEAVAASLRPGDKVFDQRKD